MYNDLKNNMIYTWTSHFFKKGTFGLITFQKDIFFYIFNAFKLYLLLFILIKFQQYFVWILR